MAPEIYTRSLEIAKSSHIKKINFFGGEPLINPQIFPMLQYVLRNGFSLILATNCRPLASEEMLSTFLRITGDYINNIEIVTARDKFHLKYFDPVNVISRLQNNGYKIVVNDYSDYAVLISEHNVHNQELQKLNTRFSCCGDRWSDALGVLPDGGWTICPTSLESFGHIYVNTLSEILNFKKKIPLRYKEGCTVCLQDFKQFHQEFDVKKV